MDQIVCDRHGRDGLCWRPLIAGALEENDRNAARNFGAAAKAAGVDRIIYLGGLGNDQETLSAHLRSRQEVGKILRESGVAVLEFRASIVIGSGSLSFEMIRSLSESISQRRARVCGDTLV